MFDLVYNVDYELMSLIVMLVLLSEITRNYSLKIKKNKMFTYIVATCILAEIADLLSAVTNTYHDSPCFWTWTFNYLYFALSILTCFLFYHYIETCILPIDKTNKSRKLSVVIIVIFEILMVLNFFGKYIFYIDEFGKYVHGNLFFIPHLSSMLITLLGSIAMFKNRKILDETQRRAGIYLALIFVITLLLQTFVIKDALLIMPGTSIVIIVSFFMLETPDYEKLQKTIDVLSKTRDELEISNNKNYNLAFNDSMTKLKNRTSYNLYQEEFETRKKVGETLVLMADLNDLKFINDNKGHSIGDEALIKTAEILKESFKTNSHIFRIGGDEFLVVLEDCKKDIFDKERHEFFAKIGEVENSVDYPFSISIGYQLVEDLKLEDAVKFADEKMYLNKKEFRQKWAASLHKTDYSDFLPSTENKEKRNILVVEDNDILREILVTILNPYYNTIEAANGRIALNLLNERKDISLIMLDIQMPIMNGYEFLEIVSKDDNLRKVPIIVTTSSDSIEDEIKCLESGASDFVPKPYNEEVVLKRVQSIIRLRETSFMLDKVTYDELTGLYSKTIFYQKVKEHLDLNTEKNYNICCFDIESFTLINDQYGVEKADALLKYMAKNISMVANEETICGRLDNEVIACLCPHHEKETYDRFVDFFSNIMKYAPLKYVVVRVGAYLNMTNMISPITACDNAKLAINQVKHTYGNALAIYDDSLRQNMVYEQKLIDSMEKALEEKEFEVYFQEKRELDSESLKGAEAFIRWKSPEMGFLHPGVFIPLFEKNGFIKVLDRYVLEETCKTIKEWINKGKDVVPVSINISRASTETPDLVNHINEIVGKYELSHELIHIEITEYAYVEDPKYILKFVEQLKKNKYKIELDDFGAGYSSLTALSEINPDVLKLDMSITQNLEQKNRKMVVSKILEMAKALNMKVVAEGVETTKQAQTLKELGATYGQGYLYSRAISKQDFESHMLDKK